MMQRQPASIADSSARIPLASRRWLIFVVVAAAYILSFFHRTAPAAIAAQLTDAFATSGAALGALAATYFYVYTLLQVPTGVLADTVGPRRIVAGGAVIAGIGSVLFGLAPTLWVAAAGRTLVGIGVSVTFIALLKLNASWFPAARFATMNGLVMFLGNLGAVLAAAPLAWLVERTSWRLVFVGLGVLSGLIAVASWLLVRDRPEACGYPPVNPAAPGTAAAAGWRHGLREVLANRATWPGFWVNLGLGGSFFAFAGLWAVPFLREVQGRTPAEASNHNSLLLLGVAIGAFLCGWIADRWGHRRRLLQVYAILFVLSWLPWLLGWRPPLALGYLWFFLTGLVIPGFTLTWAIAKEVNRPILSGMATSVVNVGIFLGAGILQPLVGRVIDVAKPLAGIEGAFRLGLLTMFAACCGGAVAAWFIRENRGVLDDPCSGDVS